MNDTLSLLIGLAMGLNLLALGTSRLPVLIRAVAAQGVLLGLLPLVLEAHALDWRLVLITLATVVGAVAGGLAGNAVEGRMQQGYTQMYRISIQLYQGGVRAYDVSSPGDLRQGDRVRLVNGQISRY